MRGFWEAILLDQLCLLDWPLSLSLALLSLAKSALLPPNSPRFHHGGWPHLQRYPALEVNDGGCPEKPVHHRSGKHGFVNPQSMANLCDRRA
jgi:hypothetical protein